MRKSIKDIKSSLHRFMTWLEAYGETSHDHQTFYASPIGRKAKSLYYRNPLVGIMACAPLVFLEAFVPSARSLMWKKMRFPIADAHYAMGFAIMSKAENCKDYLLRATQFLNVLEQTRCRGFSNYCWGYPFDWETRNGIISEGTPLITSTPYMYEAFSSVYDLDKDERWHGIMKSIAEHAAIDIKDIELSPTMSTCTYTPDDEGGVVNASAYRAYLLTNASIVFSEARYWEIAEKNINFVLQYQRPDGAWYYSIEGERDFVDHFHTCFVLKALAKIEKLTGHEGCAEAIRKGIDYYLGNLLDEKGLPKPFSKAPRLTVYRRELYDYAECINLCVLLRDRVTELNNTLDKVIQDLLSRWQKTDGSFRSRELYLGWDNLPMHRWAQSQLFRSLALYYYDEGSKNA
jgi:hypothetical protein